jgi:hypothetical protein
MTKAAIDRGDKRGGVAAAWAKIKFDRQIVAIAKVFNVSNIYSDDEDVRALAAPENISVISLAELPLPPAKSQSEMQLAPPREPADLLSRFDEESDTSEESDDESTGDEPV